MTSYWTTIRQLICVMACHWYLSVYWPNIGHCIVWRHFFRHYKELPQQRLFLGITCPVKKSLFKLCLLKLVCYNYANLKWPVLYDKYKRYRQKKIFCFTCLSISFFWFFSKFLMDNSRVVDSTYPISMDVTVLPPSSFLLSTKIKIYNLSIYVKTQCFL